VLLPSFLQKGQRKGSAHVEVYMVNNRKGGVGKTSTTENLAADLAAAGFYVGIADGDDQANATSLALPRRDFPATLTDVIIKGTPLLHAMRQVRKRLWIIPADEGLKEAASYIAAQKDHDIVPDRVVDLREALPSPPPRERLPWWNRPSVNISVFQLEGTTDEEFVTPPPYLDFLFFDSPPQENDLTISMIYASDKILIPVEMDQFSVDGLAKLVSSISRRFRHRTRKVEIVGIVPNKILHKAGNPIPMDFLESVWRHFPNLARRPIHHDDTIPVAQAYQQVALELNRDSRAARELCALALELAGYEGDMAGVTICEICDAAVARAQEAEQPV
jgi:chromosome partitioning protein